MKNKPKEKEWLEKEKKKLEELERKRYEDPPHISDRLPGKRI